MKLLELFRVFGSERINLAPGATFFAAHCGFTNVTLQQIVFSIRKVVLNLTFALQ